MSADDENEYFAEGISEELINALAQFPNLRVIARTSSFSFKGKNVDVREMGRALGVGHIVEGSVRKAASALRITAQLIDAVDGSHLWAARYDRTLADAFVIQDEITSAIRDAVGATLFTGADTAKVQTDEETYDFFLRGRALPVAGQFTDAEAAACAMIENDPRYPEGYHMRGYTRNYMGRFQEAEDDLRRVPTLGNRSGWPLAKRSIALTGLGRLDDVRQILDAMHARRATEFITPDAIGCVHQLLGQNDEAFHWLDRAVHEQALWAGFVGVDPIFAPLRRDARFESFCQAHGLPLRPLPPSALDKLATPSK